MSLSIVSTDKQLSDLISLAEKVHEGEGASTITTLEFQAIRNEADVEVGKITIEGLSATLADVQKQAAALIESLQKLVVEANIAPGEVTERWLSATLSNFQEKADSLSESLQKLGIAARRNKLGVAILAKDLQSKEREEARMAIVTSLKKAVEYQLAYVVFGYKTSVERL